MQESVSTKLSRNLSEHEGANLLPLAYLKRHFERKNKALKPTLVASRSVRGTQSPQNVILDHPDYLRGSGSKFTYQSVRAVQDSSSILLHKTPLPTNPDEH